MKKILIVVVVLIIAAGAAIVLAPRFLDNPAAPVSGELEGETLVLQGAAFGAPDSSPEQSHAVTQAGLQLSVLPDQPPPTPAERGVRILLTPGSAMRINDQAVMVEVHFVAPSIGAASGLAISLQGIGPAEWVAQPVGPGNGVARYELPAQFAVDAVGLRALSQPPDDGGELTITQIRITPALADASAPGQTPSSATGSGAAPDIVTPAP